MKLPRHKCCIKPCTTPLSSLEALICPPAGICWVTHLLSRTPTPDHRHRCVHLQEAAVQPASPAPAGVSREELQAVLGAALQAMQEQVKLALRRM